MATRVYTMLPPTTTWMVVLPKRPRATELGTPFVTDLATPPATFTSILGVPLRLAVAVIFRALVPNASGTTYGPARVALNAGFSAPGATTRCSRWSLARISAAAGVSGAAVCVTGRVPAVSPSVTSAARVPATTDGCARIVLRLLSMRRAARVSRLSSLFDGGLRSSRGNRQSKLSRSTIARSIVQYSSCRAAFAAEALAPGWTPGWTRWTPGLLWHCRRRPRWE